MDALKTQINARKLNERTNAFIPAWPNPQTWLNGDRWQDSGFDKTDDNSLKNKQKEIEAQSLKIATEKRQFEAEQKRYEEWKLKYPQLFKFENENLGAMKKINERLKAKEMAIKLDAGYEIQNEEIK